MSNEADTCRQFVVPGLQAAGWDTDPHTIAEERCFTDGASLQMHRGAINDTALYERLLQEFEP